MSMRKAINEMCRACIYDEYSPGNWRQQVQGCTSYACPLYPLRPVSKSGQIGPDSDNDSESEAAA